MHIFQDDRAGVGVLSDSSSDSSSDDSNLSDSDSDSNHSNNDISKPNIMNGTFLFTISFILYIYLVSKQSGDRLNKLIQINFIWFYKILFSASLNFFSVKVLYQNIFHISFWTRNIFSILSLFYKFSNLFQIAIKNSQPLITLHKLSFYTDNALIVNTWILKIQN